MERVEPSLETQANQASCHVHDDDSIAAAIISAACDADRDDVRDLCSHHTVGSQCESIVRHTTASMQDIIVVRHGMRQARVSG